MKIIKAEREAVILVAPNHCSDANAKPDDINERITFVSPKIPQGGFEIVSDHKKALSCELLARNCVITHSVRKLLTGFAIAALMD
jgi:hypothetical protein